MPKLTIDNQEVEVEQGTSIIQAAEQIGIEIPRFCYHDRLTVPANCRMCLVEVEGGPPKPVASCAMACGEGMVVKTDSPMVKKARKGVMEMLLINHPLDCPICDQGGECDLQDQAVAYGYDRSRYQENKRAVKDKPLGPLIKTIMTRCINCTRCVRFGEEIAGVTELGQLNRGENAEIGTFIAKAVSTELSGNMIDICPVGALTSKPYAFKARSWELRKTETIDVHDALGCNIRVDSRGSEVMRVLPRLHEEINEEWINDRTRFAYDGLKKNRLDKPYVRDEDGKLKAAEWSEALSVVAEKLKTFNSSNISAYAGDMMDTESLYAFKDLATRIGIDNLECRVDGANYDVSNPAGYSFNSGIAGIDDADAILIVGSNPRHEATLVNARIRRNYYERNIPVGVIGEAVDLTYPYDHIGTNPADLEKLIKARSGFAKVLKDAKNPMIIVGAHVFTRPDGAALQNLTYQAAEKFGMISDEWNGFNVLQNAAGRMGALEIGFVPNKPFDLADMGLVFLMGVDNPETVNAVHPHSCVIYMGHHGDLGAHRADVILPSTAYTEKSGTYMNTEGRAQKSRKAVDAPGEGREDWAIIRALSEVMGYPLEYNDLASLRSAMISAYPRLGSIDEIITAEWVEFGDAKGKITNDDFINPIEDFYLTNPIARSSATMLKCSNEFTDHTFQEAAE